MDQVLGSSSRDLLVPPIPGGRNLTTQERELTDHSATISGWGSDLEPGRRPGVPRDKAPHLGGEMLYPPIERQATTVKIHKSTEHGQLTPVFGTSCPPRGLSGVLRDFAYRFSEGRLARWLTLMFADRVNMAEGLVGDLAHGHLPNIPREMGLRSELEHNREAFVRKTAIVAGFAVLAVVAWKLGSRRSR
jgi:hypothetical protein